MHGLKINAIIVLVAALCWTVTDGLIQLRHSPELKKTRRDARRSGINSVDELPDFGSREWLARRQVATEQFLALSRQCKLASIGVLFGCARQLLHLSSTFGKAIGGELFVPDLTEDLLTREFLESMPLPPSQFCCRMANKFHSNLCACDTNTILLYRNMGYFDPLQTPRFANFLYGEQCGVNVVIGDQCPGGNPFDMIGNGK